MFLPIRGFLEPDDAAGWQPLPADVRRDRVAK
jgi:hypothetical protein